ncbi:MAG: MmcQ/YjbR family DNA-binding protein [Clostridia bacterium]|nr:MmcQ/YjbR family DNA-binding protein [Clostridia bacterium]
MFEEIFMRKKVNTEKLLQYGFVKNEDMYQYSVGISDDQFVLNITIDSSGKAETDVLEKDTGEEYVLYKTKAEGAFVGAVRSACEDVLTDISTRCYETQIFRSVQAKRIMGYVFGRYGDELEYLWKKFPDNAVLRRRDNAKWYAAILTVPKNKLGLHSSEIAEIIDLRAEPEEIASWTDNEKYFPGWHMNKKYWYTIILDNGVPDDEIYRRIDESYLLAK